VAYEVKVDPGVIEDFQVLGQEQDHIPEDWRLKPAEVDAAIDQAIRLIASLRDDPFKGELMAGRPSARVLEGCRRLKFDPREPWPRGRDGRPRPRLRLVWINEPDESAIRRVRVISATHRFDSRPYRRAAKRLGEARRSELRRERR
jgi:hypothetical protein